MNSISSAHFSRSVSFTSASKEKLSASGSTPASSPIRTLIFVRRIPARACASAHAASRIEFAMESSCMVSANPWQLISGKHIHNASGPQACAKEHLAGMPVDDRANDLRLSAQCVLTHGRKHLLGNARLYNGDQLTFISNIERIKAQQFTGPVYFFP